MSLLHENVIANRTGQILDFRTSDKINTSIIGLFNSGGGKLSLHFDTSTPYLPTKKINETMRNIEKSLQSGFMFRNVFRYIQIVQEPPRHMDIIVRPPPTSNIISLDYNLLLPLGGGRVEVCSLEQIRKILNGNIPCVEPIQPGSHVKEFIQGNKISDTLLESQTAEFKLLNSERTKHSDLSLRIATIGHLNRYISSFANYAGGHIYYGIHCKGIVHGQQITYQDQEEIKHTIGELIGRMKWPVNYDSGEERRFQIHFEQVKNSDGEIVPSTYVIVVYVAQCLGGVFTGEPESYEIIENEVKRMDFLTWKKKVLDGPTVITGDGVKENAEDESDNDKRNFELYQDAIKHGEKRNNRMSLFFIGHCGVGKTSLKKSLLGEESDIKEPSTVGIEFDVVEVNEKNVSEAWQRSTDKQYMASEEYSNNFIAKEEVKREIERWKKRETDDGERVVQEKVKNEQEDGDGEGEKVKRGSETTERSIQEPDGSTTDGDGKISTPEKENTLLTDDLKHKIEQAWKNVDNYRDDTMDTIRFLFGDVGGQSVYYDVHSIMLRLRSLFIFVFDLGNTLYDKAQATFVDKETKIKQKLENHLEETNFDYAKKWMAAVQDLRPRETENPATKAKLPKVLVVFTKADTLDVAEAEQRKAEASKAFSEYFGPLIVAKYTIKNTHPRSEEETRELQELRKKIFETAQEVLLSQEKTPINWLVLERTLGDWMKTTDLRFITLDEAREIGEECEVNKTFGEAIKFFHEENIVVHFDGEKPLSELVVLDPAWLVELLTKVITVRPDRNCDGETEKAWHDLTEKGVLNFERLPNPLNELSHKEALKEMMVRARLICHWKDGVYFVPSMVTKAMEKEQLQRLLSSCLQPSLYIVFDGDCIPLGFFTRIQVECITWCLRSAGNSTTPITFCNFGRFYQNENGVGYSVIFIRHISRIQVAILGEKSIWDSVAKSVLLFLRKTIDDICQNHPSFNSTRVKFGLKCDLCCEETTKCQRHQKESCSDDDCACILHLDRFQEGFVNCDNNYCGDRNVSQHHESPWVGAAGGFKENAEGESHQEMPSEVSGTCSKFLGKLCIRTGSCEGFIATYVEKRDTEFESKPHVFPLVSGNEIVGTAFVLKDRNSKSSRVVSWSAYNQPTCQMIVRDGRNTEVRSILLRRERKDHHLQVGTLPDGISISVHDAAPSGEEGTGIKFLMASRRAVCGSCKGLLVSRLSKICPVKKLPDGRYVRVGKGSFESFPIGSPLLNCNDKLVAIVTGFGGNKITVLSIEQCFRN